ncbi:hypothetical protein MKW94_014758 [Papaver nudicaule]|uniref:Leucine-rich repeat-containing N-terminal plant-type domain-containing protein n=1 Tax=Papaver nudicaule TaxID=74823 RepID=A0AA41VEU8_PAPNU|nr:hypothetical protein [Papaver nudicaule]
MRSSQGSRLFLVFFILSFSESWCVQRKCLHDQRALLLQLNSSLIYESSRAPDDYYYYFYGIAFSSKRSSWSVNTDCCSWDGISCDGAGRVISLDLSFEYISGGINSSSSLFNLHYLEILNLAYNFFNSPILNGFDQLLNLKYLNLSKSGFLGQVPVGILRMPKLSTLDLSSDISLANSLRLDNPDFEMLTHNLTGLRELWLDRINISEYGSNWCRILATSLPKLQVLSLSYCSLSGPLDSSLLQLQSLKILRLSGNNLSSVIPDFFGEFRSLVSLDLSDCELYRTFPERIFNLKTLRHLDISSNERLQGSLPEFPTSGLLQELVLSMTSFGGELPNSIGNLKHLSRLELDFCGFNGSIPDSISNLNQLQRLGLSSNSLSGIIPPVLFTLPSLRSLRLFDNEFTGHLGEFESSSPLDTLFLSGNKLQGRIPASIFELSKMEDLDLSSNNFSGTLSLEMFFHKFKNLNTLDLSYNSLSITTASDNSTLFPQVRFLFLGSCNLTKFPIFLKNQSNLKGLDLSSNNIHGKIPNWIWKIGNGSLGQLNISHNFLEDPYRPFPVNNFTSMAVVDVHSNKLQGKNPILPPAAEILDYSLNNFTSMIPYNSSYLSYAQFITFSGNQINGNIPVSICKATYLNVLDLSHNNLSGPIPQCPGSMANLAVLNLRGNNLQGFIPETFLQSCSMKTLNLNQNRFEGQVAKSLANCTMLEVLDVGNNRLTGVFPSWLESMQQLHVLVLRSNQFYGPWGNQGECNFSTLQIFDISYNNFSGILSNECFLSWKAMMVNEEEAEWNRKNQVLEFNVPLSDLYYQQTVTVRMKGMDVELIPGSIGNLTSLCVLNFSNNGFTGPIPSTFGYLTHLESLDLSRNKLSGEIPFQLAALSFLSTLKLSFNRLVGRIPSGSQMQTFPSSYFEGNDGLCGYPLSECSSVSAKSPQNGLTSDDREEFEWILLLVTFFEFVMGASVVIGPQYFWKRGREWANERINRILNIT